MWVGAAEGLSEGNGKEKNWWPGPKGIEGSGVGGVFGFGVDGGRDTVLKA